MAHKTWLSRVAGDDTTNAVATRAGIYTATLSKQLARGKLSPENIIAIARAYRAPILDSLVACGIITEAEAAIKNRLGLEEALHEATDDHLLRELLRRVDDEGSLQHPALVTPLDERHSSMRAYGYGAHVTDLGTMPYAASDRGSIDIDQDTSE